MGVPGGDADAFMASFNQVKNDEDAVISKTIQQVVRSSRFSVGPTRDFPCQPWKIPGNLLT
jgi:hypothetical protein